MQDPEIEQIIVNSILGTASARDLQKLRSWRKLSRNNELSYQLLRETWEKRSGISQHPELDTLERQIIEAGFDQPNLESSNHRQFLALHKVAAAVILICLTAWYFISPAETAEMQVENPQQVVTYNPTGHKSKITLPDNSVIYLNAESTLSYLQGFSDSIRYVQLDGEAYFEVEHDENRPFVVETGGIETMALGTSFNIRNYPEDNSINVSLLSGKVKVTDNQADSEVFLEPLENVAFDKEGRAIKMTKLERDDKSIWKDGILFFRSSTFENVIKSLERTYDVEFDTSGYSSTDWSYNGKFDNQSLEIVLTRIGYSEGFTTEIEGRTVRIANEPN